MAKSSVPGLDRVRDLFTSAERAVLESTAGKALVEASQKQLAATLAQARALRDKWRDLHATQARSSKRTAGAAGTNARSREKTDMFSAAVERIQSRLGELGLAPAAGRPAPKAVTKAARQAGHRTTRAGVKGALAATAASMNGGRAASVAPRAATKPAAAAVPAVTARPAAPVVKRAASKKRRPAKTAAAVLGKGGGQAVRFDVAKQRSAKASATAARLKLDGKATRRGGHVLAAGKRRQAARDRRGR